MVCLVLFLKLQKSQRKCPTCSLFSNADESKCPSCATKLSPCTAKVLVRANGESRMLEQLDCYCSPQTVVTTTWGVAVLGYSNGSNQAVFVRTFSTESQTFTQLTGFGGDDCTFEMSSIRGYGDWLAVLTDEGKVFALGKDLVPQEVHFEDEITSIWAGGSFIVGGSKDGGLLIQSQFYWCEFVSLKSNTPNRYFEKSVLELIHVPSSHRYNCQRKVVGTC